MKNKNLLIALVIMSITIVFSSCTDDGQIVTPTQSPSETPDITENGTNPDEAAIGSSGIDNQPQQGFIYLESNDAGLNTVLVFRQNSDGLLTLQSTESSGGNGSGGGLGNQGAITINHNEKLLFAVNAGSNSVSSFRITHSGDLTLVNTIATGGIRPISVTNHGHILYVVNAGSDNISGFTVNGAGVMISIPGSIKSLSGTGADPAQISFSPNGNFLYVTEKATNKITTFPVNAQGVAGDGSSISSTGQTPFGFDISRDRYLIVSNAAGGATNASSSTSYSGINAGNLSPVNGAVPNNQTAACWVAVTKHGRFAFVTNTGSDNISSYYVAPFGGLFLVHEAISTEDAPTEIIVSENNRYVYALNSASHTISSYRRALLGNLTPIGTTSGLPAFATGIAAK